ncbi:Early nodulin-like protein [Thalictrum thalictroides]|uniref:Early nodulin-like protein n=1 Tax=Thalictrum thalictroides TaxID=46969 RepID=A0A7J6X8W6_THATH|nr:Early nodulin-like protein [Thalictrum thalictroides]
MASSVSSCSMLSFAIFFFILFSFTQATNDVLLGGKTDSWKIPSSPSESLNKWTQKARFVIGDALILHYNPDKDSVLQVNRKDYLTCNTSNPMVKYHNETTMILFDRSGPLFFISGAKGHCEQGQKMIVVVLSEIHTFKGKRKGISPAPSPSPIEFASSPMVFDGPAVAPSPTSGAYSLRSSGFNGQMLGFAYVCLTLVYALRMAF